MGTSEIESATRWLSIIHISQLIGAALVAIGVAMEFLGSFTEGRFQKIIDDARTKEIARLNNDTAGLRADAAKANERAAITEQTLLKERRLTANERWRLARLEKAILPRAISKEQHDFLVPALKGKFSSINVCALDRHEPRSYAFSMIMLLKEAGISANLTLLPKDNDAQGVSTYFVNKQGELLADILWKVGIGGSMIGVLTLDLQGKIHPKENCLIIGENNAAFQPGDGQPGEDIDEHGNPVPRP